MNVRSFRSLSIGLVLVAASLHPVSAAAEGKKGSVKPSRPPTNEAVQADDETPAKARRDPDNITAPSEFTIACTEGARHYLSRDLAEATKYFRNAIQLNPKNPVGYFYLGETQLALGNTDAAETAFRQAELSADSRHPDIRAHVLFMIADVLEREKRWPAAREGWQAYLEWVGKFPEAGVFPASATSRIQAIDTAAKQDKSYDIVRKRIAETARGNVFTDVSSAPAAGKT